MEKLLNDLILTAENCVIQSALSDMNMNDCITSCNMLERITKAYKVCYKFDCKSKVSNPLQKALKACCEECHTVCSKHQADHCKKCAKQIKKFLDFVNTKKN